MANISKIKIINGNEYNLVDAGAARAEDLGGISFALSNADALLVTHESDTITAATDTTLGNISDTIGDLAEAWEVAASSDDGSGDEESTADITSGVRFIDYDGTVLYAYTTAEALALSALPANPSHDGLTAQGWNWSLADIKDCLNEHPDAIVNIGQIYATDDGKTRIYIHLDDPTHCSPYLAIGVNGTVVVDWGDGSNTDTMTGTSLTTQKYQLHEYAATGDYIITLNPTSGSFAFFSPSSSNPNILKRRGSYGNYAVSPIYASTIKHIEIGSDVVLGNYAFNYLYDLESVTIPKTILSIGTYAFQECRNIKSITIPETVTSIGSYAFYRTHELIYISFSKSQNLTNDTNKMSHMFDACYNLDSAVLPLIDELGTYVFYYSNLRHIVFPNNIEVIGDYSFAYCAMLQSIYLPNSVTSIGNSSFTGCFNLKSVRLSESLTSIGNSAFSTCYSLETLTIPASVTSIGSYAFNGLYEMRDYHFLSQNPPTLANTNAFYNIQSQTVIYVPQGCLEVYQTAENWSTYASYMQEEPS